MNYLNQTFGGQGDINKILNEEIKRAQEAGLDVLYCIGEKAEEQDRKYDVLRHQLEVGLVLIYLKLQLLMNLYGQLDQVKYLQEENILKILRNLLKL